MTEAAAAPDRAVLAGFAVGTLLLGMNFVAVPISNRELAPFWGAALRFAVAAAVLFGIMAARRVPFPTGQALQASAAVGALGFGGAYALMYWALVDFPSGLASVIFATVPLTTFLLAVTLRMERFHIRGLAGAAIVVGGIVIISLGDLSGALDMARFAAVVVASLVSTLAGIVVKRAPRTHPASMNAVAMAVGTAILLAAAVVAREPIAVPTQQATWAAVSYLVFSTVVAFLLWVWLIGRWTVSAVSYQTVLMPLVTIAVAAPVLGEGITGSVVAGTAIVLGGVYLGIGRRRRAPVPPAPAGEESFK